MALSKTAFTVRFARGIDTKTDRKAVLSPDLLVAQNVVFERQVTLVKRFGHDALSQAILGSTQFAAPDKALTRRGSELLSFGGGKAFSLLTAGNWSDLGGVESVPISHRVVAKTATEQTLPDCASLSGVAVYTWTDSLGGVWYALEDAETGRRLQGPTQASATGTRSRCQAVGTRLHVYYVEPGQDRIYVIVIDPTDIGNTPPASILIEDLNTTHDGYDVDTDGDNGVIVWHAQLTNTGKLGKITPSGRLGSSVSGLPPPVSFATAIAIGPSVAIDPISGQIAVAWSLIGVKVRSRIYNSSLVVVVGLTNLSTGSGADVTNITCAWQKDSDAAGNRVATAWWEQKAAAGAVDPRDRFVERRFFDDAGGTGAADVVQRGVGLAYHGFTGPCGAYVGLIHDTELFATYFTQRHDGATIARYLGRLAGGVAAVDSLPGVEPSGEVFHVAQIFRERIAAGAFSERSLRRVALDFADPVAFQKAEAGESLYLSGGFLQVYDGDRWQEASFHYGIDGAVTTTLGTTGSGGLTKGTRSYRFVLENVLANGELELGPLSSGTTVVITGTENSVTIQIPTYRLTNKPGVRIGVFRSKDGDAATFRRISSLDPSTVGANGFVANDPTVDAVTFIDEMSDTTLQGQELLYTNGSDGILQNEPPGAGKLIATGKNRMFATDPGDPLLVRFSQEFRLGCAVEWPGEFRFRVEPFGGPITGLIAMDDKQLIFKETAVFETGAPGPDGLGRGGFSQPAQVNTDSGCIEPRSLVYAPLGVAYQSRKGIYLMGRELSAVYVGAKVERFNSQKITAATLIEDRNQIRFLTDAGETLHYNYRLDQWSTFTNHEGRDAVVVGGTYHYLRNDGRVFKESTAYKDDNLAIRMAIETAWLHLGRRLQGLQRLWHALLVGEFKSLHTLRMFVAYDFNDEWVDIFNLDPSLYFSKPVYGDDAIYGDSTLYGGVSPDDVYQQKIHLGRASQSVKFRFEDIEPTGEFGAAFELTELLVTAGFKRVDFLPGEKRLN